MSDQPTPVDPQGPGPLCEEYSTILDFERTWWRYPAAKATEILTRFGLTETSYYKKLHRILTLPQAMAYDAQLTRRLIRLRDQRREERTTR